MNYEWNSPKEACKNSGVLRLVSIKLWKNFTQHVIIKSKNFCQNNCNAMVNTFFVVVLSFLGFYFVLTFNIFMVFIVLYCFCVFHFLFVYFAIRIISGVFENCRLNSYPYTMYNASKLQSPFKGIRWYGVMFPFQQNILHFMHNDNFANNFLWHHKWSNVPRVVAF